jgi:hypothetical protein
MHEKTDTGIRKKTKEREEERGRTKAVELKGKKEKKEN